MLSARRAAQLTDSINSIKTLLKKKDVSELTNHQSSSDKMELIAASIHSAVRDGFDSCVTYLEPNNIEMRILTSHGYTIEEEIEEDTRFYVISWENAGTDRVA